MDSTQILRYVFGCGNINKAAILDPNDKKTEVQRRFSFILKIVLNKAFS